MKTKIIAHGVATLNCLPCRPNTASQNWMVRTVYKLANYKHDYEQILSLDDEQIVSLLPPVCLCYINASIFIN